MGMSHDKLTRFNGHWVGEFNDPCWQVSITLIWPVDAAKANHYIHRKIGPTKHAVGDDMAAWTWDLNGNIVIGLSDWAATSLWMSNLAHESVHAADYILASRGMQLTSETSEAYAYLAGSIVRRSLDLINRAKVKSKRTTRDNRQKTGASK